MNFTSEIEFITEKIRSAYKTYAECGASSVMQKSHFDLVTDIDINIEKYLSAEIVKKYPDDKIHGEETSSTQALVGRTWIIDPIDGTCNMARNICLHGVQCALFVDGEPALGVIYLPHTNEMFYASVGGGAFLNGEKIHVNAGVTINNVIASMGDYSHVNGEVAKRQHDSMGFLYPKIAKIRMFGAACFDFAYVAMGKTDCTVVITKNLWDIAPGVIICKEAGAIIRNLEGEEYSYGDEGVVASANEEIADLVDESYKRSVTITDKNGEKHTFKCCLFDFDGVVVDTEKYHLIAWNKGGEKFGVTIGDEEYLPLKSTGRDYIVNYIAEKSEMTLSDEDRTYVGDTKENTYVEITRDLSEKDIVAGIEKLLMLANDKGVPCGVGSSSIFAPKIAKDLDLDKYFKVICDGSLPLPKKPAPDLFLLTARLCGFEASDCVVFEDSMAGVNAALNAGMKVVAIGGIKHPDAMLCIKDFTELEYK